MIPKVNSLLTVNGYPTDEWLNFIKNYNPQNSELKFEKFLTEYLPNGWHWGDLTCKIKRTKNYLYLELHTGGWGGNKEIISTILENIYLRIYIGYYKWLVGGHYYFKINNKFLYE